MASFSDDDIRAIVETGELSDSAAEEYLVSQLIARRNAVVRYWLGRVTPLDSLRVEDGSTSGRQRLSFPEATELRFPRVPGGPPFGALFESLRPTWMPELAPGPELDQCRDSVPAARHRSAACTLLYPDFAAVVRLVDARQASCYGRPWSQAALDVDVRRVAGEEIAFEGLPA